MKEKLIAALEKSRLYTLQVVAAMPEARFSFKPAEYIWSFGELSHHMAYCMNWMDENYLQKNETAWSPTPVPAKKNAIIAYLEEAYLRVKTTLEHSKLNEESVANFFSILEHTAHHRGQATTYLRCVDITPPEYPF